MFHFICLKNSICVASPVGYSAQHCCSKYGFTVDDISCVTRNRIAQRFFEDVEPGVLDIACVLLEMIFIRNGVFWVNQFAVLFE